MPVVSLTVHKNTRDKRRIVKILCSLMLLALAGPALAQSAITAEAHGRDVTLRCHYWDGRYGQLFNDDGNCEDEPNEVVEAGPEVTPTEPPVVVVEPPVVVIEPPIVVTSEPPPPPCEPGGSTVGGCE